MFFHKRSVILVALLTGLLFSGHLAHAAGPSFSVSFPKARSEQAARWTHLFTSF